MINTFKTYLRIALEFAFGQRPGDYKKVPILINNYNRLTTLQILINDLEARGYSDIRIIDNNSTYPPLLDFYASTSYKVYRLKKNIGFKALWKSGLYYKFWYRYFCYTDSDLHLVNECPPDFMEKFYLLLRKYPMVHKVGFSLRIDDLPEHYAQRNEVIAWETKFYVDQKEPNVYIAPIDTTFALYRPFSRRGQRDGSDEILRTGFPYQCHHLPWYTNTEDPGEEELYYFNSVQSVTHWTGKKVVSSDIK